MGVSDRSLGGSSPSWSSTTPELGWLAMSRCVMGSADFCYLPRDFASGKNMGHAFLNLVSSEAAAEFQRAWHGRPTCAGRPVGAPGVEISVASVQGLAANIARSENPRMRRVRNPEYRPLVLDCGALHVAGRH
ncbi:unnamed protein product [Prorocentrum cordatum]|uniref:Mei2-like C-terminal RNA recognition motif domain-containing protein n=1 Tax=Prorocentrum cordatum TaxID=2364126 RepID=A0ABN9SL68_9DINO|nr:unnamed protein product [Polarella glacialis]